MGLILRRRATIAVAMALAMGAAGAQVVVAATAAGADFYSVPVDHTINVPAPGVLSNDTNDGGTPCVTGVDVTGLAGVLGDSGNTGWGSNGSFTFTPSSGFSGVTSFKYGMAALSNGSCVGPADAPNVVVTITVGANDQPTATLGPTCDGGVTVAEDSGAFSDPGRCVDVTSWGVDEVQAVDGWVITSNHPELFSAAPSISTSNDSEGRLSFTPAPNATGAASVSVRVRDDGGTDNGGVDLSDALIFSITITPKNDPPTAFADNFIVLADRTLNVKAPGVLFNDSDIDGDSITAIKVTPPLHGVVTLAADGAFSYTPVTGYRGLDAFSYRASDGAASSPTRIVTLNVTAIPPTPTPTPIPTIAAPSGEPSPEATIAEPSPGGSIEAQPSLEPGASPGESPLATTNASPEPGPTAVPGPTAGSGGGLSLPALLLIVLLAVLVAFGAAIYVPKWLNTARTGRPPDDGA